MGWNKGYEIMELQVIGLYDLGILNKEALNTIMQPFCNTDIDAGGSNNLKSKDGKSVEDIICLIIEPEKYRMTIDSFIPDPEDPNYNEDLSHLYYEITRREWNFR